MCSKKDIKKIALCKLKIKLLDATTFYFEEKTSYPEEKTFCPVEVSFLEKNVDHIILKAVRRCKTGNREKEGNRRRMVRPFKINLLKPRRLHEIYRNH